MCEAIWVEAQLSVVRHQDTELVLPPCGQRGSFSFPEKSGRKEHPNIPSRGYQVGDADLKCLAYPSIRIPVVRCSVVLHQVGTTGNVFLLRTCLARPDDVNREVLDLDLFQQALLDFGDPPKTNPSGRRRKKDRTHVLGVGVEVGAQRFEVGRQGRICRLVARSEKADFTADQQHGRDQ